MNTFRSLLAVILLSVQIYIATAMAQQSCPLNVNTRLLQNGYSVLTCKPGVPGSLINDTLAIKDVTSYGTRFGNGEIWPQDQNPNTPLISSWTPADFNISGTGDQEVFSLEEMIDLFDLDNINKAPASFNQEKLIWLNQSYIKNTEISEFLSHCRILRAFSKKDAP